MSAAGTYARVPMGEAFDVMCKELDDIVNRMCGIEEVALAYQWMQRHSCKVPDRLGGEGAVGQAAVSGSATTNREPERAPSPPSLVGEPPPTAEGAYPPEAAGGTGGSPTRHPRGDLASDAVDVRNAAIKPPQSQTTNGHVPPRHLAAVPEEAA